MWATSSSSGREKIATDGVVIEEGSRRSTSMLTGESIPVDKTAGATVIGGSINQMGSSRSGRQGWQGYRAVPDNPPGGGRAGFQGADQRCGQCLRLVRSAVIIIALSSF